MKTSHHLCLIVLLVLTSTGAWSQTAMPLPEVQLQVRWLDDGGLAQPVKAEVERTLAAALTDLCAWLLLPADSTVKMDVRVSDSEPTGCSSSDFVRVDPPAGSVRLLEAQRSGQQTRAAAGTIAGGKVYTQLLAAHLFNPGFYDERPSHASLILNRGQLERWWFDPEPESRSGPLPERGRVDAFTILQHELLHALCFNGWLDSATGVSTSPNKALSLYDCHTVARNGRLYFTGPRTSAFMRAALPLTARNYKHYGQGGDRVDIRLSDKLMFGDGHQHPFRAAISGLDLALLADCGLPLRPSTPVEKYMALAAPGQEARWEDYSSEDLSRLDALIRVERGTLPLLLEVPHDGLEALPGITQRRILSGGRDTNCAVLAERCAQALQDGPGKPWLLILKVKREWLDVNQDPGDTAYQHEFTRDLYDRYYYWLYRISLEIMASHGRGFQFSIHCGGNLGTEDIYFGTNDRASIRPFRALYGEEAFQGQAGLPGLLAALGYRIPGYGGAAFHRGWTGGVAARYTYRDPVGMDSCQIEVERIRFMHDQEKLSRLATDLATALEKFLRRYYALP